MPSKLSMYGATNCEDTEHVREYLAKHDIEFTDINIDYDSDAELFVVFINHGNRTTPTLVLDQGAFQTILTEPSDAQLRKLLKQGGFNISRPRKAKATAAKD